MVECRARPVLQHLQPTALQGLSQRQDDAQEQHEILLRLDRQVRYIIYSLLDDQPLNSDNSSEVSAPIRFGIMDSALSSLSCSVALLTAC